MKIAAVMIYLCHFGSLECSASNPDKTVTMWTNYCPSAIEVAAYYKGYRIARVDCPKR